MSEVIPEDVMAYAGAVFAAYSDQGGPDAAAQVAIIARGILAERKRIANVARTMRRELDDARDFDKGKIAALGYVIQACEGSLDAHPTPAADERSRIHLGSILRNGDGPAYGPTTVRGASNRRLG